MPGGDRKGPVGMGRMTGRAAGYCAGFMAPGRENLSPERRSGMGFFGNCGIRDRGFGGGRGRRNIFLATGQPRWMRSGAYASSDRERAPYRNPDPEMEIKALRNKAQILQAELDSIGKRLAEIKTGSSEQQM